MQWTRMFHLVIASGHRVPVAMGLDFGATVWGTSVLIGYNTSGFDNEYTAACVGSIQHGFVSCSTDCSAVFGSHH